jgi:hypothetical protein
MSGKKKRAPKGNTQMDHELAAINDAELALIKRAIEENLEKKLEGAESAGTVAAEQAIASRGLLTLVDVKLALLPRIGRGVEGVFSAYVRSLRADGVGTVEPVSGVDAVEADVRRPTSPACSITHPLAPGATRPALPWISEPDRPAANAARNPSKSRVIPRNPRRSPFFFKFAL